MIVKWLQLKGQPVSMYLIIAATEASGTLYMNPTSMHLYALGPDLIPSMVESAAKSEIEFEVVHA